MAYKDYKQNNSSRPDEGSESMKYRSQGSFGYRVRSPVKSFRDLEVYQRTIQLYAEIIAIPFLSKREFEKHRNEISETAESIPRLIAESYGDKFDSKPLANQKITQAITLTTNIITKLDILREQLKDSKEEKEILDRLLTNYQRQKLKILNLRKAWQRISQYGDTQYGDNKNEMKSPLSSKR